MYEIFSANVPAPITRLAIRLAKTYNHDITLLLPEERLAFDYIAFGTSIFDESFQIPVSADDLPRLADPSLTTEQFHALYRQLADINRPRYRQRSAVTMRVIRTGSGSCFMNPASSPFP